MYLGEKVAGARPGGHDRHFCVPLYTASAPQVSTVTGIPPRLVTVSTRRKTPEPFSRTPISDIGLQTPVDVSAWTTPTAL
jgi:hypothetical protein